jgi:hypothetical protein
MHSLVVCAYCNTIYDLTSVHVTARYAECSMFQTPCCNRQVDTRSWKSFPDYHAINLEDYRIHTDSDGVDIVIQHENLSFGFIRRTLKLMPELIHLIST